MHTNVHALTLPPSHGNLHSQSGARTHTETNTQQTTPRVLSFSPAASPSPSSYPFSVSALIFHLHLASSVTPSLNLLSTALSPSCPSKSSTVRCPCDCFWSLEPLHLTLQWGQRRAMFVESKRTLVVAPSLSLVHGLPHAGCRRAQTLFVGTGHGCHVSGLFTTLTCSECYCFR